MSARTKKRTHHGNPLGILLASVASIALTIATFGYRGAPQSLTPATRLPEYTARINIPGPITFAIKEDSPVLGASLIDPHGVIDLVNQQRTEHGIATLRTHPLLMEAAQRRANVIMKHQNFSHHDPYEQVELTTVLPSVGYAYSYASENIGMGDVTPLGFVNGFMDSPSHRANMLDPKLQDIGVAVASGPYREYYVNIVVQLFAIPGGQTETLGYTPQEVQMFRDALKQIDDKLMQARVLLLINYLDKRDYYEDWIALLKHQRTLVNDVLDTMTTDQPLTTEHIRFISEYNQNWTQAPVYPT